LNNFLYYGTSLVNYPRLYGTFQRPFNSEKDILTQLPKNVVVIRALAILIFTSLVAFQLSATVFCWPVALAGTVFAGWTIYLHLLSKDPLMEAFYKITGCKDRFEALPEINLGQGPVEKISHAIERINWDHLNHPIARTRTLDGRNVIIIKGLSRNDVGLLITVQTKTILAFIEKANSGDFESTHTNFEKHFTDILHALMVNSENNNSGYSTSPSSPGNISSRYSYEMRPSISSDMANEFFAQLALPG
jgi:hypothetical protein